MQKCLIKCAVAGAAIVFIWGMFSWMVLPWHKCCMKNFRDEHAVGQVIAHNAHESGIYTIPGMASKTMPPMMHKKNGEKMHPKPFVFASVKLGGMDMGVHNFVLSFVFQFIAAYIIAWLLMKTKGLSYMGQVGFVVLIALVAGVLGDLPAWNWVGFPCGYTLVCMLDMLIAWFLAGLAMAKICCMKGSRR